MRKNRLQRLHEIVHQHIHDVWAGRTLDFYSWELGPITKSMPEFRVARVEPNQPKQAWIYMSVGLSEKVKVDGYGIELLLLSPCEEPLHVELLAMIANYGCDPATTRLGLHSILDIGRPWLEGSSCDHLLFSLPYILGPRVEWPTCNDSHKIRILWLLPISAEEASFAKIQGVEALERKFDAFKINPMDPRRVSVV